MTSTRGTAMCSAICKTWEGRLGDPGKAEFSLEKRLLDSGLNLKALYPTKKVSILKEKETGEFLENHSLPENSPFSWQKGDWKKNWRKTTRSTLPKTANENCQRKLTSIWGSIKGVTSRVLKLRQLPQEPQLLEWFTQIVWVRRNGGILRGIWVQRVQGGPKKIPVISRGP